MGKKWRDRNQIEEIPWIGYAERAKAKNRAKLVESFVVKFVVKQWKEERIIESHQVAVRLKQVRPRLPVYFMDRPFGITRGIDSFVVERWRERSTG
jgi:hypothetical protein